MKQPLTASANNKKLYHTENIVKFSSNLFCSALAQLFMFTLALYPPNTYRHVNCNDFYVGLIDHRPDCIMSASNAEPYGWFGPLGDVGNRLTRLFTLH